MAFRRFVLCLGGALLIALPALSQGIPTGTLSGRVSADKQPLPGVTVTVTSPSLQGARTATTSDNGGYNIPLLPPGEYKVDFEIEGFQKAERTVKISVAQSTPLDLTMSLTGAVEQITVIGSADTAVSTTTTNSTTYSKQFVEDLPIQRNIVSTVLLTPGVNANGAGGGITISGSQSYENLFLVNGVVVNENLRGQPLDLFIEDSIEETTTSTSGISAEYGRFAGGVVNTVTKSGGNEIHGSFRTSFTNDSWTAPTPLTEEHSRADKINERYEATLGGWLLKDRLWYFAAGRQLDTNGSAQTTLTNISYPTANDQKRGEGKLTLSPFEGQRLIFSYIDIKETDRGNGFGGILDLASVDNRELPQSLQAFNYTGVITPNVFLEGQYSRRKFAFVGDGSRSTDEIQGTVLYDNETGNTYNTPIFCGICKPETRDNKNWVGKGSWFVSSDNAGSHDLAFGYDSFHDQRLSDNHQSGSDFWLAASRTIIPDGKTPYPVFSPGDFSSFIVWWPILEGSRGADFRTDSAFINDKWRLSNNFSFNLGLRYDKNHGVDSEGKDVSKDSTVSPRLGLAYDLKGDGDWIFNATYGKYVNALANTQGDATSRAGNPSEFLYLYNGPAINTDPNAPLVPTQVAMQQVFNWFHSVGFTNDQEDLFFANIPGGTTVIRGSLASPSTQEYSVGVSKRLGTRGIFRADLVHRKSSDFYSTRTDLSTGTSTTPDGTVVDLGILENDNGALKRQYNGLHTQLQYRATDRINVGFVYTLSHTYGTIDGESSGSGPISTGFLQYPEYRQKSWNLPDGDLASDQRHRFKGWFIYDIFKNDHNRLNFSVLENYDTGTPYGAVGSVSMTDPNTGIPYIANPGYQLPPQTNTYYYTSRDAFRTPNLSSTDITFNYSFDWNAFSKQIEVFLEPEVLNVFNEHKALTVNTTVLDSVSDGADFASFNPFTSKPTEGVNWAKGSQFGKAASASDYQTPRTFRFSVGFRF